MPAASPSRQLEIASIPARGSTKFLAEHFPSTIPTLRSTSTVSQTATSEGWVLQAASGEQLFFQNLLFGETLPLEEDEHGHLNGKGDQHEGSENPERLNPCNRGEYD